MNKFSDKISNQDIDSWKIGDTIILNGGTGTGKTYFIVNALANKVKSTNKSIFSISSRKKILYICNRIKLMEDVLQEVKDLGNDDIIDVTTYQAIQSSIINNKQLKEYEYYVFDETHYFTSDSTFNKHTDLSYKYAISRNNAISIYMSATANELFTKIKNNNNTCHEYIIEKDYSYVEKMFFLSGKNCIKNKIVDIMNSTNDKIVYFCNSTEKAYELYLLLQDKAHFYCSKNNKYGINSEKDCIKQLNDDVVTFDKQLLITTVALDNGINLKDIHIKHIFCDVFDTDKLIQCLGRKRIIDTNDTCRFYLKKFSKREINGYKTTINNTLKPAKMFRKDRCKFDIEYIAKRNFPSNIIYPYVDAKGNESLIVNELQYSKYILDLVNITKMNDIGYKKYIMSRLGTSMKRLSVVDEEQLNIDNDKQELEEYLSSCVGNVMLQVKDRKELIERLDVRSNGKLLKKINNLNGALEEQDISYRIVEFATSRMINGEKKKYKNAWKVEKLIS